MVTSTDFESKLAELERVVAELDGELKLERALELFETGLKLSKECEQFLTAAEQRIEILKRTIDGEIVSERIEMSVFVEQAVTADV